MDTIETIAASQHFEYVVNGQLVIVRAVDEQQAQAALRKRYGFGASIESPSLSVLAGGHAA